MWGQSSHSPLLLHWAKQHPGNRGPGPPRLVSSALGWTVSGTHVYCSCFQQSFLSFPLGFISPEGGGQGGPDGTSCNQDGYKTQQTGAASMHVPTRLTGAQSLPSRGNLARKKPPLSGPSLQGPKPGALEALVVSREEQTWAQGLGGGQWHCAAIGTVLMTFEAGPGISSVILGW